MPFVLIVTKNGNGLNLVEITPSSKSSCFHSYSSHTQSLTLEHFPTPTIALDAITQYLKLQLYRPIDYPQWRWCDDTDTTGNVYVQTLHHGGDGESWGTSKGFGTVLILEGHTDTIIMSKTYILCVPTFDFMVGNVKGVVLFETIAWIEWMCLGSH